MFLFFPWAAKMFFFFPFGCKMGCENVSFFPFCCEMASKLRNGYKMAFRLQKLTCKIKRCLRKHFAKPREVVKMRRKPRNHASKEKSPFTEITHKASHSISYLLKLSEPIAPGEETMPSKETTITKVKVLIQPTQEATTDASAP